MILEVETVPNDVILFLEHLKEKGRKQSTITRYYRDLLFFFEWIKENEGEKDWKQLDKEIYRRFYEDCKEMYRSNTIKRIQTVIRSFQRYFDIEEVKIEGLTDDFVARPLTEQDFVKEQEFNRLFHSMGSTDGLTDNQFKSFPHLFKRNQSIAVLFYHYGLRMTEITRINMEDINFAQNEITVKNEGKRTIKLTMDHKRLIYSYYKDDIPEPVRPFDHSNHPLFVSFDFERETFRWNYEKYAPQRLSVKAIQKMVKNEVIRAGLRKGVSGRTMRNSCILKKLKEGIEKEEIQRFFGLINPLSLWRYEKYIEENKNPNV